MERRYKAMSAKEIERFAKRSGLEVVPGGSHKLIISLDGRKIPLPRHGARQDLPIGTRISILKFIEEHNSDKKEAA